MADLFDPANLSLGLLNRRLPAQAERTRANRQAREIVTQDMLGDPIEIPAHAEPAPSKGLGQTIKEGFVTGVERAGAGLSAMVGRSPETIASDLADVRQYTPSAEEEAFEAETARRAKVMDDAEGFADTAAAAFDILGLMAENPKLAARTVAESLGMSAPAYAAALTGAGGGSLIGGPVGAVVGGLVGYVAGNLATNVQAEMAGALEAELAEKKIDTRNPAQVAEALRADPSLLNRTRAYALKKGGATTAAETAVDVVTLGAGRVLKPARSLLGTAGRAGGVVAGQGVGEGAGNIAGSVAVGEDPSVGEAFTEGAYGAIAGAPEGAAIFAGGRRLQEPGAQQQQPAPEPSEKTPIGTDLATREQAQPADWEVVDDEQQAESFLENELPGEDQDVRSRFGTPFLLRSSAEAEAARSGGEVVEVPGGFVVRRSGDVSDRSAPDVGAGVPQPPLALPGPTVAPDGGRATGGDVDVRPPVEGGERAGLDRSADAPDSGGVPDARRADAVVLQNRDRSSAASIAQMAAIAADPDPARLSFSREFGSGAPVVFANADALDVPAEQMGREDTVTDAEGQRIPVRYAVVEADAVTTSNRADGTPIDDYADTTPGRIRAVAGNGRMAGLQAAYQQGTTGRYREGIGADEALHGIPAATIAGMRQPVLVRVMRSEDVTDDIGDRSNVSGIAQLSPVEQARTDMARVNLDGLEFLDSGQPTPDAVKRFVQAMPASEQASLMERGGEPGRQAVDRLMAATFAKAYDSDDLVQLYAQAQDPEARNVLAALAQAAGAMSRLDGTGVYDVRPTVTDAARVAVNAARRGVSLAKLAQQQDIDLEPNSQAVVRFFAQNARSARRMGEGLQSLAERAHAEATRPEADMFGPVERRSREEVIGEWDAERSSVGVEGRGEIHRGGTARQTEPRYDAAVPRQGRVAESDREGEGFLTAPTPQGLAARAESALRRRRETEQRRAAPPAEEFVLTGSDRPVDQAAARGQADLFGDRHQPTVDAAAKTAATSPSSPEPEPTEAMKRAGNYKLGHTRINGLDISIENEAGSRRRPEWPPLTGHYGYVKRTMGADGDQVDVFVKPGTDPQYDGPVYIVDQVKPDGSFDEHKVMLGWPTQFGAVRAYKRNYTRGWKVGRVRRMTMDEFKTWLTEGDTTKPVVGRVERALKRQGRIEDFGEKVKGARKDVWASLRDKMQKASALDIAAEPLSKSWPAPDYQALLDDGADPWSVAFMHAARDEIPTKPQKAWRLKEWVASVRLLRDVSMRLIDGSVDRARAQALLAEAEKTSRGMRDIAGRIELYQLVGHSKSLAGVRISRGEYGMHNRIEYNPPKVIWTVEKKAAATAFSNWPRELANGDTKEQALANFKEKFDSLEINRPAGKETTFEIYSKRGEKGYWVGKKVGRNPILLEGPFDHIKEARTYKDTHNAELTEKLARAKEIPSERRDTNEPRVGEDFRAGRDATPELFAETFGFRGVQFGNYVEQAKRQQDLNDAFDALMDMAAVLGVKPRALSLNGELALAFGARGKGGKGASVAHYEREHVVINLTKREGAGSLGHEWWHALDNYFSRMRGQPSSDMTDSGDVGTASRTDAFIHRGEVRREMVAAFGEVLRAIHSTAIRARSSRLDAKRTKAYWTTNPEMSARAFESYLISKLQDQGASNDYLANIVDEATWAAAEKLGFELEESYPYPTAGEVPAIRAAFDRFFQSIETRETERGVAVYEPGARYSANESQQIELPLAPRADTVAGRAAAGRGTDDGAGAGRVQGRTEVALETTPDPQGIYHARTALVADRRRTIAADRVTTPEEAARALASVADYAVEHFHALVTDAQGRPLALAGMFKGTTNSTAVYPNTIASEVFRIKGAKNVWLTHNHPSGTATLSAADRMLFSSVRGLFEGTGIDVRGIFAQTYLRSSRRPGDWTFIDGSNEHMGQVTPADFEAGVKVSLPVVERVFVRMDPQHSIFNAQDARNAAERMAAQMGDRPFVMLLSAQNAVVGAYPLKPGELAVLRKGDRAANLIRAISTSGAAGSIIVDPKAQLAREEVDNVFGALRAMETTPLDVIARDGGAWKSEAERGRLPGTTTFRSRRESGRVSRGTSTGRDTDAVEALRAQLRRDAANDPALEQGIDTLRAAAVPNAATELVAAVRRLYGTEVVFVTGDENLAPDFQFDGVYIGGSRVYASATSTKPFHQVVGHEFLHQLKRMNRELYEEFAERVRPYLLARRAQDYANKRAAEYKNLPPAARAEAGWEETFADAFGDAWNDPALWKRLADAEPRFFRRLAARWRVFVMRLRMALGMHRRNPLVRDLFTDFDAVRDIIADVSLRARTDGVSSSGSTRRSSGRGPVWFSELARKLTDGPRQAAAAQWKSFIKGLTTKGVKPDEIEFSGINEFLDLQEGKISRDDVLRYLDENGVQVDEVLFGERAPWRQRLDVLETRGMANLSFREQDELVLLRDRFDEEGRDATPESKQTQYDSYRVPGGENYRELLLTLPATARVDARDVARELGYGPNDPLPDHARDEITRRVNEANRRRDAEFRSSHWREPNVLAHIRFDERTDTDGKRVLFIHEIQSDWAQAGRKHGFRRPTIGTLRATKWKDAPVWEVTDEDGNFITNVTPTDHPSVGRMGTPEYRDITEAEAIEVARRRLRESPQRTSDGQRVPRAPFIGKTEAWVGLALKRMTRYAAENGFDRVAIVTGQQAADMFDLSKRIQSLHWSIQPDGQYELHGSMRGENEISTRHFGTYPKEKLPEVVGKEVAEKIVKHENKPDPEDLALLARHDIQPWSPDTGDADTADAFSTPEGVLTPDEFEDNGIDVPLDVWDATWRVVDARRRGRGKLSGLDLKIGGEGMRGFYDRIVPNVAKDVLKKLGGKLTEINAQPRGNFTVTRPDVNWSRDFDTRADAEAYAAKHNGEVVAGASTKQVGFDITPEMRERAMGGFAMFSRSRVSVPDAVIGATLGAATRHSSYQAAKSGDAQAAARLARDLVSDEFVEKVRALTGRREPVLMPVVSVEAAGRNKIPLAVAEALAARLGLTTTQEVVQSTVVRRTGLDGLDRLFTSPEFVGDVQSGVEYLLIDDTITQGGTFAALAGFIEGAGGRVVGAVALTGKQYSAKLSLSDTLLEQVRAKFGDIEEAFRSAAGHGFDALTESEARYLVKHNAPDAIRDRILAAGEQGRRPEDPSDPDAVGTRFSRRESAQQPPKDSAIKRAEEALRRAREKRQRAGLGNLSPEQEEALRNVGGLESGKTLAQRFSQFRDNLRLRIVQGLVDQFAPIKRIDMRAYTLARLSRGADGTLEAAMLFGKPFLNGGVADVKMGDGFAKTLAGLEGEHDRFLWWVAAQRAERLKGLGLENLFGETDIAALKGLRRGKMPSGKDRGPVFDAALEELNAFNDSVLRIAEQSGLIDEETRQMFKDMPYVPFYRVMDDDGTVRGMRGSNGLVNQTAWKKLRGGTQKLNNDLLANLLMNWSHLFTASARNRAAVKALSAAYRAGVARDVPAGTKGAVRVMEHGQPKHYVIDDPHLMDAVSAIEYAAPKWFRPFSTMKRWLTIGVTANPAFKIRNLIRDTLSAQATTEVSYNPAKNVAQGWKAAGKSTQTFASMLASGGVIRFGTMLEGDRAIAARNLIRQSGDKLLDKRGWARLTGMLNDALIAYNELGDRAENANRAALYEQLRAKGYSVEDAAFAARDLLDFSMSGKWEVVRFLTQTVPFLNARLQGLYKLGRAAHENPRRFGYVAGAVSLASLALMLGYQDDDDWKHREDWDRDTYWWFKIGNTAYRIPKPFEVGAIGTLAERTWELFFDDEMTMRRYGERVSDMIAETFSMDPTPQIIKPLVDVWANQDSFTGRPIESESLEGLRPEDRFDERSTTVARALGAAGLPNPVSLVKGDYDPLSPRQIDFMIRGYLGWLGTTIATLPDYALRPLQDRGERPTPKLRDVFLLGNFVEALPAGSSRYVTELYKQAREAEQAYASARDAMRRGEAERGQQILADEAENIRRLGATRGATRALSRINQRLKQIESSRVMAADAKRAEINELEQLRRRIAREAVTAQ